MRYTLQIEGERHGFVNMISDKLMLDQERFVASRVRHPLCTFGEVIVDAEKEAEARTLLVRACEALISDCESLMTSLGMSYEAPVHMSAVDMPTVVLNASE